MRYNLILLILFLPYSLSAQSFIIKNFLKRFITKQTTSKTAQQEVRSYFTRKNLLIEIEKQIYKQQFKNTISYVIKSYTYFIDDFSKLVLYPDKLIVHITASTRVQKQVELFIKTFEKHPKLRNSKIVWDNKPFEGNISFDSYYLKIQDLSEIKSDRLWNKGITLDRNILEEFIRDKNSFLVQTVGSPDKFKYYTRIIVHSGEV